MLTYKGSFVVLSVICIAAALDLPADFIKCKRSNLNECLKGAIQDALPKLNNGLPEFKLAPLDPLVIPNMNIGQGTGAVDVTQNYNNVRIYGASKAIVNDTKIEFNGSKFVLAIDLFFDPMKFEAEYNFNGRILLVPIVGDGEAFAVYQKLQMHLEIHGEEFTKKGEVYYDVTDVTMTNEPESIEIKLMNLFGGDERLSNEINKLMNENWKVLWDEVKDNYQKAISVVLKDLCSRVFKKVPAAKLFPLD